MEGRVMNSTWRKVKLGELGTFTGGGTPSRKQEEYFKGTISWLTIKDLKESIFFVSDSEEHITSKAIKESTTNLIDTGSVIIAIRVGLGKVAINLIPVAINQDLRALKPHSGVLPEFALFVVLKATFNILKYSQGTTVKGIKQDDLNNIELLLPPLPVQERIVQILQKADEVRRKRKEALQLAEAILPATFHDMFGYPEKDTKWYNVKPLIELVKDKKKGIKCGPFGSQLHISELTKKGIPVLGIENVDINNFIDKKNKYVSPEKYLKLKSFKVVPGDVLITRTGTAGRACIIPEGYTEAIIGPNLLKVSIDPDQLLPEVFSLSINYNPIIIQQIKQRSPGSTVAVFNVPSLKTLLFTLPPIRIQQEFLKQYEQFLQVREKMLHGLHVATSSFETILSRAFTGELTAEWEAVNADWIQEQVALQERLPRLILLAFIRERLARAEKTAQAAVLVTALMKYAFLFQMEGNGRRRYYQFEPYLYGPFAKEVYTDLERLQAAGLVSVTNDPEEEKTRITLADPSKAEAALADLPHDLKEDVTAILNAYGNLDHNALLKAVYEKYPAYAKNSRLKKSLASHRSIKNR